MRIIRRAILKVYLQIKLVEEVCWNKFVKNLWNGIKNRNVILENLQLEKDV